MIQGKLKDGTMVAIKVLSTESRQGVREFLTELTVISDINHENLVRLYGCCVEGTHRILVYPYMENNSLARTLLGTEYISYHFFTFKFNFSSFGDGCLLEGVQYLLFRLQMITALASSYLIGTIWSSTFLQCSMPLLKHWWGWHHFVQYQYHVSMWCIISDQSSSFLIYFFL